MVLTIRFTSLRSVSLTLQIRQVKWPEEVHIPILFEFRNCLSKIMKYEEDIR